MANGTITGSTNNQYISSKLVWSATTNVAGNYSLVSATLYYSRTNTGYTTSGTWKGSITINGVKTEGSKAVSITYNSNTVAMSVKDIKVSHNANGSKSITISASGGISGTSFTSTSLSKSVALDTIPRKATITSAPNFNDEQNPTVTYSNPAGSAATVDIGIYKTDASTALVAYQAASATGTSFTFSLTSAQRTTLQNACKDSTTMKVRFYIRTTIGSNKYYHYVEKTLSIINSMPTLSPTAYDTDNVAIGLTGDKNKWIKGYSDVTYNAGLTLKKGATLKSCSVSCGGVKSSNTSGTFSAVKGDTIVFSIEDSRGHAYSQSYKASAFIDYFAPTCNVSVDTELVGETTGKATLRISGKYFTGNFGAFGNSISGSAILRVNNVPSTHILTFPVDPSNPDGYACDYEFSNLNYANEYTVQINIQDTLHKKYNKSVYSATKVISFKPVFDWGKEDFNFNVPVYYGGLCLSGAARALTNSYTLDTSGTTAGTNWTNNGFTATLLGTNIRCAYDFTRSAATNTGNITNETILNVKMKHDGKVKALYPITFASGGTGPVATYAITDAANDGTYITFKINIAATAGALTQSTGQFILPVVLNLDKY